MSVPRARDLMTPDVVTIPPELPVIRIALLLCERGISAVPVVSADGSLLGIVTEADLLRRLAATRDRPPSWLATLFINSETAADRYARTHGFTAEEVMTVKVVTVPPNSLATQIAALMERHRIRHVPILEQGRLCGIVSRGDLLRALEEPRVETVEVPAIAFGAPHPAFVPIPYRGMAPTAKKRSPLSRWPSGQSQQGGFTSGRRRSSGRPETLFQRSPSERP